MNYCCEDIITNSVVQNFVSLTSSLRPQDPVVQSIVSLTISLGHKFVKQISAKVTNTLLFFVEKGLSYFSNK